MFENTALSESAGLSFSPLFIRQLIAYMLDLACLPCKMRKVEAAGIPRLPPSLFSGYQSDGACNPLFHRFILGAFPKWERWR